MGVVNVHSNGSVFFTFSENKAEFHSKWLIKGT